MKCSLTDDLLLSKQILYVRLGTATRSSVIVLGYQGCWAFVQLNEN